MRKLRIAYYSIFIAFILLIEAMLIGFEIYGKIGMVKNGYDVILYLIPLLVILPLFCLIQEIKYYVDEKKAIKNDIFVNARFEDMEELKNLLYRGYKIKVNYLDKDNKKKSAWTQSNFTKNQANELKELRTFDVFVWKEKVFIKLEYLDTEGLLKKVHRKKINQKNK